MCSLPFSEDLTDSTLETFWRLPSKTHRCNPTAIPFNSDTKDKRDVVVPGMGVQHIPSSDMDNDHHQFSDTDIARSGGRT